MEMRLIDIKSLTNIQIADLNVPLVKSVVMLRSNAKPVIVTQGAFDEDLGDFTYRVVGNQDVALAVREAYRLGEMEMANAVITTEEQAHIVAMQF